MIPSKRNVQTKDINCTRRPHVNIYHFLFNSFWRKLFSFLKRRRSLEGWSPPYFSHPYVGPLATNSNTSYKIWIALKKPLESQILVKRRPKIFALKLEEGSSSLLSGVKLFDPSWKWRAAAASSPSENCFISASADYRLCL